MKWLQKIGLQKSFFVLKQFINMLLRFVGQLLHPETSYSADCSVAAVAAAATTHKSQHCYICWKVCIIWLNSGFMFIDDIFSLCCCKPMWYAGGNNSRTFSLELRLSGHSPRPTPPPDVRGKVRTVCALLSLPRLAGELGQLFYWGKTCTHYYRKRASSLLLFVHFAAT